MKKLHKHPKLNVAASTDGKIFKIQNGNSYELNQYNAFRKKYKQVRIADRNYCSHRIVWECCSGSLIPLNNVVHHRDHNGHNNSFLNLDCITQSENIREGHEYKKSKKA